MTSSNEMDRNELLKLAALDVFGLLDEIEAEIYNRSFHHAPAGVQDEIIALQAAIASDESLLPSVQPDPTLRERVLARVAKAVEEEAARLAPIATIGRGSNAAAGDAAGHRTVVRAARFWRAACFVLAAGLIVTLYLLSLVQAESTGIAYLALQRQTGDELRARLGPGLEEFMNNPDAERIVLRPAGENTWANGVVFLDQDSRRLFVLTLGLPENQSFTLRRTNAADVEDVEEIQTFTPENSVFASIRLDRFDVSAMAAATWEIVDKAGTVVLTSAV